MIAVGNTVPKDDTHKCEKVRREKSCTA